MKFQRGDAGVAMLAIMAVMMIGLWFGLGHGGSGHHSMESMTNETSSVPPDQSSAQKNTRNNSD